MRSENFGQTNLEELYQRSETRELRDDERIVIFSDLHMGNGSRVDDFVHNGDLFSDVLRRHYAPLGYHLILNGDVEDLQRFPMRAIVKRWPQVYAAFSEIAKQGDLTRIVGNHDIDLLEGGPFVSGLAIAGHERWPETYTSPILEGLRLQCESGELFLFHGHQTSRWFEKHNSVIRLVLRYLANPLRIGNITRSPDSGKRIRIEERAYAFASRRKILAIIGHTHRPLFESMSKSDSIQFEIERLCRKYPKSRKQAKIATRIEVLKEELLEIRAEASRRPEPASLYREHLLVPSLFNSGCVLGKRGITALEIEKRELRLVYWFDELREQKNPQYRMETSDQLPGTGYRRAVIKQDSLAYIFSRIRLLA